MRLVILESPYASDDADIIKRNITYARACIRHSLSLHESPIASHLLYTQEGILDDTVPEERNLGIEAGLAWREVSDGSVVYMDFGISSGMEKGIRAAQESGRSVEMRLLPPEFWPDSIERVSAPVERKKNIEMAIG